MHIARVLVDEMATPVIALGVDGVFYDVAKLEAAWGVTTLFSSSDFHTRVVSARSLGLHELDARLRAGARPKEARLRPHDVLPLPPCDTGRAAWFIVSAAEAASEPQFVRADARTLVGDAQPVPIPHGRSPELRVGVAVMLGEDLFRASAQEAARAVLGVTLYLSWGGHAPSTLGPVLIVGRRLRDLLAVPLRLRCGAHELQLSPTSEAFRPAECLAFVSQHAPLAAGDVIGLPSPLLDPLLLRSGDRATLTWAPLARLSGWGTEGPAPRDWRI